MTTRTEDRIAELRHRVEAKRNRLEAKLEDAKADATAEAAETRRRLRGRIEHIDEHLRDGWGSLTDAALAKVNDWLKDDRD